jgi:hypothetical protein
LWLPTDIALWAPFQYFEVARWRPDRGGVIREHQPGCPGCRYKSEDPHQPLILKVEELEDWRVRRENLGLYTSVFQYDSDQVAGARRIANLYFDLDDHEDENNALPNARTLVAYLINFVSDEAIRIYFTGQKGFHVEVELVALGIGVVEGLSGLYRYMATGIKELLDLSSMDFHVYDARRMWRLPNSEHQGSGLFKIPLTASELELDLPEIWELALEPRPYTVPDQTFEPHANEWIRYWMMRRFEEQGAKPSEIQVPMISGPQAQRMLERQLKSVTSADTGSRNHSLNRAAFLLGKLVNGGLLPGDKVEDLLMDAALAAGLEERESKRTIASGMSAATRV